VSAPVKGFGCRPLTEGARHSGGRRTKPSKGRNRGKRYSKSTRRAGSTLRSPCIRATGLTPDVVRGCPLDALGCKPAFAPPMTWSHEVCFTRANATSRRRAPAASKSANVTQGLSRSANFGVSFGDSGRVEMRGNGRSDHYSPHPSRLRRCLSDPMHARGKWGRFRIPWWHRFEVQPKLPPYR
jgi:hypothetical protein